MKDTFKTRSRTLESPGSKAFAITPDDASELAYAARAIYVGGDGNISITTLDGDDVVLVGVKQGSTIPISIRKVKFTGTSAFNLVGIY